MSHLPTVWLKENQVRLVGSSRSFTCNYNLTAVPHAGLGYHFLRVQVDQANSIDDHATD